MRVAPWVVRLRVLCYHGDAPVSGQRGRCEALLCLSEDGIKQGFLLPPLNRLSLYLRVSTATRGEGDRGLYQGVSTQDVLSCFTPVSPLNPPTIIHLALDEVNPSHYGKVWAHLTVCKHVNVNGIFVQLENRSFDVAVLKVSIDKKDWERRRQTENKASGESWSRERARTEHNRQIYARGCPTVATHLKTNASRTAPSLPLTAHFTPLRYNQSEAHWTAQAAGLSVWMRFTETHWTLHKERLKNDGTGQRNV
ncbi:hypothetical protein WMY93_003800 [Mugilogobius chulae]|uniref:Uncharacterized protein n=1 Tax=Mugilogobius chulae TaxID=88201 RepID=A0AAW0Q0N1_9GOBI